jgi:hypothetical protein
MAKTLTEIEEAYLRTGWKETVSSDGSILFEREARPSVISREHASAFRRRLMARYVGKMAGHAGRQAVRLRRGNSAAEK